MPLHNRMPRRDLSCIGVPNAKDGRTKGISTHFRDWLGSERYKVLPDWHLGKGIEKEELVAPRKPLMPSCLQGYGWESMLKSPERFPFQLGICQGEEIEVSR